MTSGPRRDAERPHSLTSAYSATGARWEEGPGRIYNVLADRVVACTPVPLAGRTVLDLGAGTGAASRSVRACGAVPIALDGAFGMLSAGAHSVAVQGDALQLPFCDNALDGVVAAFCLNHVFDPVRALREVARVTAPGGPVVVSSYAADDTHPVKAATEAAMRAAGWKPAPWYLTLRDETVTQLASAGRCLAVAAGAGLNAECHELRVTFPDLTADDLVAWRLGMAQHAPFVAALGPVGVAHLRRDALDRLGPDPEVLVRSIIVLTAVI